MRYGTPDIKERLKDALWSARRTFPFCTRDVDRILPHLVFNNRITPDILVRTRMDYPSLTGPSKQIGLLKLIQDLWGAYVQAVGDGKNRQQCFRLIRHLEKIIGAGLPACRMMKRGTKGYKLYPPLDSKQPASPPTKKDSTRTKRSTTRTK